MADRATPEVERVLREAVLGQVAKQGPPEAAQTLDRLQHNGMSRDEAIHWMTASLLQEMSVMLRDNRPYDCDSYVAALNRLPGLIDR